MITKHEIINGIDVYHVSKNISDAEMDAHKHMYVKPSQIDIILQKDADVYTDEGKLLLKFRKHRLNDDNIHAFYDNVIKFAQNESTNRKLTSGLKVSKHKNKTVKQKDLGAMTNILGYFDRLGPSQKALLRKNGITNYLSVRETRFNMEHPDKFKLLVPLIKEIDREYKSNVPEQYRLQHKKARQTHFKIADTAFTTVTTNVNFKTTVHTDKGDDGDGFGNLAVIEHGKYTGGETCFPQYGVGADVRTGDVLFMDVHEWHGNLPIHLETPDAKRLSIVCYLRYKLWEKTRGKTKKFMKKHLQTYKQLLNDESEMSGGDGGGHSHNHCQGCTC